MGVLAQEVSSTDGSSAAFVVVLVVTFVLLLAIAVLLVAGMWKMFAKAGRPGWAALIPIYNTIVMLEIVGRPAWWIFLMFVPFVNIFVLVIVMLDLAKSFGKSSAFAVGLILLTSIFVMILGFGSATYLGPAATWDKGLLPPMPQQ